MDYDKLIERLYQHNKDWGEGRTQDFFRMCLDYKEAALAIETLQIENQALRNAANGFKAENSMLRKMQPVELSGDDATSFALAQEVSSLRAELEIERDHRIYAEQNADDFLKDCERLDAELKRVTAERDAAVDCIEKIQQTRDHTRPSYVVDQILEEWHALKAREQ